MLRLTLMMIALATPVAAQERISTRDQFVSRVADRQLSRVGIGVTVTQDGRISGSAFGTGVTGSWDWSGAFFCRKMEWGSRSWDRSCQAVQIDGDRVYFIGDKGRGSQVYLNLP